METNIDIVKRILGLSFEPYIGGDRTKLKTAQNLADEYTRHKALLYDKFVEDEITEAEYNEAKQALDSLYAKYKEIALAKNNVDITEYVDQDLLQDKRFLEFLDKYKDKLKSKADVEKFVEAYRRKTKEVRETIFGDHIDDIDKDLLNDPYFQKVFQMYGCASMTIDELEDFIRQYRIDVLGQIEQEEKADVVETPDATDNLII